MLNFLVPIISWVFVFTDNSNALNECLGKGYLKFLSIKGHYCTEDNILCWAWLFLVIILISNIIDVYCIYQCIKDIKKSTEKSRNMLSMQAYTNRKRFDNPRRCFRMEGALHTDLWKSGTSREMKKIMIISFKDL